MADIVSQRAFSPGEIAMVSGQPPVLFGPDGKPLPPNAFKSPFDPGPLEPLPTRWPEPDRRPREYQYTPGWNLIPAPRGETVGIKSFKALRALADLCWQVRVAIKYRKEKIAGKKWAIQAREDGKSPKLAKKFADEIEVITEFFHRPNPRDGVMWHQWIKQFVEEVFVTDASTFFMWPRKDGKPYAYVQVNGETIKPLIDEFAGLTGFQQIIWGYPATYYPLFSEDSTIDAPKPGHLRYCINNPRVDSVYGTSPLEEIAPLIDTAVRKQLSHLFYYTEGNVPTATLEAPEGSNEVQVSKLQTYMDSLFSGDLKQQRKVRVLPHGANLKAIVPFQFSKEESEEIVTAIMAHFATPKSLFISQVNRATAEETGDESSDSGQRPLERFIEDTINDWISADFGTDDVGFVFIQEEHGDTLKKAQAIATMVNAGIVTVDEARAKEGMEPMAEEDKPKPPVIMAAPGVPPPPGAPKPGVPGASPAAAKPKGPPPPPAAAQKAAHEQLAQWRRFALKRVEKGKQAEPFEAPAIPGALAAAIHDELIAAATDAEAKLVFERAEAILEKAPRTRRPDPQLEQRLIHAADRYFKRQKADVMRVAREKLTA
jgi:hypothetical protein